MKWKQFIIEVKRSQFDHHTEPGRYLFGKVLHDSLHYLNNFMALGKLISQTVTPPNPLYLLFNKWETTVAQWVYKLDLLWERYVNVSPSNDDKWLIFIQEARAIPNEISVIMDEAYSIPLSDNQLSNDLRNTAISNLEKLDRLLKDIQSENYMHLWTSGSSPNHNVG